MAASPPLIPICINVLKRKTEIVVKKVHRRWIVNRRDVTPLLTVCPERLLLLFSHRPVCEFEEGTHRNFFSLSSELQIFISSQLVQVSKLCLLLTDAATECLLFQGSELAVEGLLIRIFREVWDVREPTRDEERDCTVQKAGLQVSHCALCLRSPDEQIDKILGRTPQIICQGSGIHKVNSSAREVFHCMKKEKRQDSPK